MFGALRPIAEREKLPSIERAWRDEIASAWSSQVAQETVGWLPGYAAQIDRGSFTPDDATLATHAGGIAHLVRVSEKLGVDAELPRLFGSVVARAIAAGRAELSYAALIEQLTPAPGAS